MNSSGYLPSHEAARLKYTEVKIISVYTTKVEKMAPETTLYVTAS